MDISYLADRPDLANGLIPGLIEHWRGIVPGQTWAARERRFREHMNRDVFPIAWIAHEDGVAVGTASLRSEDLEGRGELLPWLGGVYVHPRFRGQGIASALCQIVADKARALGFDRIFLFTFDRQSLYARLGWQQYEATSWHGHAADIMCKILSAR